MKTLLNLSKSFGTKGLLITVFVLVCAGTLFMPLSLAQEGQAERQKIVQQIAEKWIQVGMEQYERGLYKASEQSLIRAKDYEDHMPADQKKRLNEMLVQAQTAVAEVQRIEIGIANAETLMAQGRNAEARNILEGIRDSRYLTEQQNAFVEESLAAPTVGISAKHAQMAQLYNQSVDYYNAGELEKAREGFLEVSKSGLAIAPAGSRAEDYFAKIDAELAEQMITGHSPAAATVDIHREVFGVEQPVDTRYITPAEEPVIIVAEPVAVHTEPAAAVETSEAGYLEVIQRRQNIIRSHTKAVVNDASAKSRSLKEQGDFDQALKSVDYAQNIVNRNRMQLGEALFAEYSQELQKQREDIETAQRNMQLQIEEQRRIAAAQEQEQIRSRMATDRQNRIKDLYDNAVAYQKQQRYEEALGQLQMLIAIDPLNNNALILRDTLEDTISFRKQLEVYKEKQQQRSAILLETSRAEIPYAKEMVHPRNWKEIAARRVPEQAIGRDPATAKVYEQLDELVDLSDLNRDMAFGDAIGILRDSVDPALRIFVMWRDLYNNADIDQTTPINMDPISPIKLSSALRLMLESVSGGFARLGYIVDNGVITIATEESLPSELVTLVYDVTDIIQAPAEYRVQVSGGAGGGGGGGVSDVGGGFQDQGQEDQQDAETLRTEAAERVDALILLIQDTIAPDSWFFAGGEGTITAYSNKLLSVRQTAEVHNQVNKLLEELRKSHGYQVAIEARFLIVQENFLEEIGLDVDFFIRPGGKWGEIAFGQNSSEIALSAGTGITGTFGGITGAGIGVTGVTAGSMSGGYGSFLDDLEVSFLLTATQAHRDATIVTAPKATVLSGESASFRLERYLYYAGDIEIESREAATTDGSTRGTFTVNYEDRSVRSGTILNITPTITPDKKYVLLNIDAQLQDFLGFRRQVIDIPLFGDAPGQGIQYGLDFPETEVSQIRTRVSVPDRGTLLLGGQKLGAEVTKEAGVPVLSKIPVLGRAFRNTSQVKDHKILLILVKPTILLQQEVEADAIASIEQGF